MKSNKQNFVMIFLLYFLFANTSTVLPAKQKEETGGDFYGYVFDSASLPLPDATVVLRIGGAELTTRTNNKGFYRFDCVPNGMGSLEFSLDGFVSISTGPIRFEYPNSVRWDQTLQIDLTFADIFERNKIIVLRLQETNGTPIRNKLISIENFGRGVTDSCGRTAVYVNLDTLEKDRNVLVTTVVVDGFRDYAIDIDLVADTMVVDYEIQLQRVN